MFIKSDDVFDAKISEISAQLRDCAGLLEHINGRLRSDGYLLSDYHVCDAIARIKEPERSNCVCKLAEITQALHELSEEVSSLEVEIKPCPMHCVFD